MEKRHTRSQCDGSCGVGIGYGSNLKHRCGHHHNQMASSSSASFVESSTQQQNFEALAVVSERVVVQNVENILENGVHQAAAAAAAVGVRSTSQRYRWLWFLLPLLLLPFVLAAREETRQAMLAYVVPLQPMEYLANRTVEIIQIKRFYHFYSPPLPTTGPQISTAESHADGTKLKDAVFAMQERLSLVEASIRDQKNQDLQTQSTVSLDSEIVQLRRLYEELRRKVDDLSEASSTNENGDADNEFNQLKVNVADVKSVLTEFDGEKKSWDRQIREAMEANEKTQRDLVDIRARFESISKADCRDCSTSSISSDSVAVEQVNNLITAAIARYDADKTGLPDFALEPAGGSIIGIRCTETYAASTRQETFFGIPIWNKDYSPRTVIQPGFAPGECWAFKGSHGYLVIKLSGIVEISAVSYEHIAKDVSLTGNIDSAPNVFEVHALAKENDEEGLRLGRFQYDAHGPALQYFPVNEAPATGIVELRILSNHGHPVYTCLYRFRVHGRRVEPAYGKE